MEQQSEFVTRVMGWLHQGSEIAQGWLLSPAAWSQFALLALAVFGAVYASRRIAPLALRMLDPGDKDTIIATALRFALRFLPLLMPLLAYGFTAAGEEVTRSLFGSGDVIAFGKRVFFFLAARLFVQQVLRDPFLKLLGKYVLVPVAALYAVGLLDDISLRLEETIIALGNIRFSVMALIRGLIAGGLLFWLGSWSNRLSADYIK